VQVFFFKIYEKPINSMRYAEYNPNNQYKQQVFGISIHLKIIEKKKYIINENGRKSEKPIDGTLDKKRLGCV
jgi:hypothetical protein